MFDDEMSVFFDEDDFAVACTRQRPGETDVQFSGILSTLDAALFEGQATTGQHTLQYPTTAVDMQAQDVLLTVRTTEAGTVLPAQTWRVLRSPDQVVDGAESIVLLAPDSEA